jgi:hypothetical protein
MTADLSQPIIYNGHTSTVPSNTPGQSQITSGCQITKFDSGPITTDVKMDRLPQHDGTRLSDAYLGAHLINIEAQVYSDTKGGLWDQIEAFVAAYSPRSPSPNTGVAPLLMFSQATADTTNFTSGFIPLYWAARAISQPWYRPVELQDEQLGPHTMTVYARLIAEDPYKYLNEIPPST